MAIVCSLHQITEQNTPTNKTGTQNQHFTCQLNMSSMCQLAVAPDSHYALDSRSFQFINWDETLTMVDHLLKGTPDGIINRVQIRAIQWPYVCRLAQ